MGYINSWSDVRDGETVIEDTYPEVYKISTNNEGERVLTLVSYCIDMDRLLPERKEELTQRIGEQRVIDFDPDCTHDQSWIKF